MSDSTPTRLHEPSNTGRIPRREMYQPVSEDSEVDTLVGPLEDDTTWDPRCMDAEQARSARMVAGLAFLIGAAIMAFGSAVCVFGVWGVLQLL